MRSGPRSRRSPGSSAWSWLVETESMPGSKSRRADHEDLREAMSHKLVSNGWPLRQLDLRRSSLEERFTQAVTQDTLADAQLEAV